MSTTDPSATIPTTSSSPSPTPNSDSNSTTLYLFTFLATILILVLLSASLVLRSCILRRRYRQRLQRAAADGLFFDPSATGQFNQLGFRRPTRRLGPPPVVWDTWIHPADQLDYHRPWSNLTPVAVRCLSPPSTSSRPSPAPVDLPSRPSFFPQLRLPSPFSTPRSASPSLGQPPPPPTSPDPDTPDEKGAATLAVCVLVAMPDMSSPLHRKGKTQNKDPPSSPQRRRHTSNLSVDEEGLPLLEFGVVEMKTRESWT